MSINAYRIIEIKYADSSFSVREDDPIFKFLDGEMDIYSEMHGGVGMIKVPLKVLRKAVRQSSVLGLDKIALQSINADIAFAKKNKDQSVTYHCF